MKEIISLNCYVYKYFLSLKIVLFNALVLTIILCIYFK